MVNQPIINAITGAYLLTSSSTDSNSSSIKPLVTTDTVLQVLREHFDRPIQNLEVIQGGQVAQTFSFAVDSEKRGTATDMQNYIVRFNARMLVNFEKEAYAYNNFVSSMIPIPRVVHLGRVEDIYFAITEKIPGQNLLQIPRSDYLALIPKQMEVLDAIHQVPIEDNSGYGIFDGNGIASAASWAEHLESVRAEEPAGDFYGNWHALFENSFLEQELFESLYIKMMELSKYCIKGRHLVHGGYGFGNVLVQDSNITAVLDWMDARYGDFLYDVAWLDFWSPQDHWRERFRQHYHHTAREVLFYDERIRCYQCYITLDAMKFYAKGANKEGYDFVKARIASLLQDNQ